MPRTCGLRLTRYYRAPPHEVWAALTEPASIERWLAPVAAADLSHGGTIELVLDGGVPLSAKIRAIEHERLLELDWTFPADRPSVVRFELRPDGEGTTLALDHTLVDARLGMRFLGIWERHVRRLDAVVGAEVRR